MAHIHISVSYVSIDTVLFLFRNSLWFWLLRCTCFPEFFQVSILLLAMPILLLWLSVSK